MRRKTPQQKKQKGYAKDRRNVYGEANKSARQMLRKRKRKPNRAERRAVHQAVRTPADVADPVQLEALDIKRPRSGADALGGRRCRTYRSEKSWKAGFATECEWGSTMR